MKNILKNVTKEQRLKMLQVTRAVLESLADGLTVVRSEVAGLSEQESVAIGIHYRGAILIVNDMLDDMIKQMQSK